MQHVELAGGRQLRACPRRVRGLPQRPELRVEGQRHHQPAHAHCSRGCGSDGVTAGMREWLQDEGCGGREDRKGAGKACESAGKACVMCCEQSGRVSEASEQPSRSRSRHSPLQQNTVKERHPQHSSSVGWCSHTCVVLQQACQQARQVVVRKGVALRTEGPAAAAGQAGGGHSAAAAAAAVGAAAGGVRGRCGGTSGADAGACRRCRHRDEASVGGATQRRQILRSCSSGGGLCSCPRPRQAAAAVGAVRAACCRSCFRWRWPCCSGRSCGGGSGRRRGARCRGDRARGLVPQGMAQPEGELRWRRRPGEVQRRQELVNGRALQHGLRGQAAGGRERGRTGRWKPSPSTQGRLGCRNTSWRPGVDPPPHFLPSTHA